MLRLCWSQQIRTENEANPLAPFTPWGNRKSVVSGFWKHIAGPGVCWLIHSVLFFELQTCELIQYVRDHSRKYHD